MFLQWWPTQSRGSRSLVGSGGRQQRKRSEENFPSTPGAWGHLGAEAAQGSTAEPPTPSSESQPRSPPASDLGVP